jgi:predicted GIY-YIG superfamily endonuclease
MTGTVTNLVAQLHTSICLDLDNQPSSWRTRCACGHYRSRHAAFTHKPFPTEAGECSGRNLAGPCRSRGCLCLRFSLIGLVYLLHFDRPYRHARHYTGFTHDLDARIVEHITGDGARLLQVIQTHGIGWQVARTWPGTRVTERALKRQGGASRRCPLCGIRPRTPHPAGGAR